MINYLKGDATKPHAVTENSFIVQVCNNAGMYGAGFSGALECAYPGAEAAYRDGSHEIGTCIMHKVSKSLTIVHMIAQVNPYPRGGRKLKYDKLDHCLFLLSHDARQGCVHMPRIGAGLAGGDWSRIEKLIEKNLCSADIPVYIYDLK